MVDTLIYEKKNNEIRLAGLHDGRLDILEIVDLTKASEGSVFLGRVTKKLELANGKVGYFVNIGDTKEAFINAEEHGRDELVANEGQEVVVQVSQEQRAEKGAKLVRSLQFVGRNLVYCPYKMHIDVSTKIVDKLKAEELRALVNENTTGQEGWIVRTSAATVDAEDIVEEMEILRSQFDDVRQKAKTAKAPAVLFEKNTVLADNISRNAKFLQKIVVNDHNLEEALKDDFDVEYCASPFEKYGIEEAITEALQKEIKLKNGGRISIEETRACVAIDVDSGDDDGLGSLGRLNNEAAEEIGRQIILRNLSGRIVVDFAGSSEYKYLRSAIDTLSYSLRKDFVKSTVLGLSKAGLVEVSRVRRRPSLLDVFSEECPTCKGCGRVEK